MKKVVAKMVLILGMGTILARPVPLYPPAPSSGVESDGTVPVGTSPNDLGLTGIIKPNPVTWPGEVVPEYIDVLTADVYIKNGVTELDTSGHIKGKPYTEYTVGVYMFAYPDGESVQVLSLSIETDGDGNGWWMEVAEDPPSLPSNRNAYEVWASLIRDDKLLMGCGCYCIPQMLP